MSQIGEEAYIESIDGPGTAPTEQPESLGPATDRAGRYVRLWMDRVRKSRAHRDTWRLRGKKAIERYDIDEDDETVAKVNYPLFWSNVQVLRGAMYSSTPRPDVRRRYDTGDQAQHAVSVAVERGLSYMVDTTDFSGHCELALIDYLVPGLGQARVQYDAEVNEEPVVDPKTGIPLIDETGAPVTMPSITDQKVWVERHKWDDFDWDVCAVWEDCSWVSFRHWLEAKDILDQFDYDVKGKNISESATRGGKKLYPVYEIWDRRTKRIIFICPGCPTPLAVKRDALGLTNFFPCPKPMMANVSPRKLEPNPDYFYYSTQETQVDRLTGRINNLTQHATVLRGFYDADLTEDLSQLSDKSDGEFVPIAGLLDKMRMQGQSSGDLWSRVIAAWPIKQTADVISVLQGQRESELNHIYQITGISDIMRGYSKASETLGAQEIKQSAVSNRLAVRRKTFDSWVRDIFRIAADLMGKHFTNETWLQMAGIQIDEQMETILRNDLLLQYSVDIETDSTVQEDSQENKKMSLEAVDVTTKTLDKLLPLMAQGLPGDVVTQILLTGTRPFKMTRNFEAALMQLPQTQEQMQQFQQTIAQMQQENQELMAQLQQAMEKIAAMDEREQAREDLKIGAEGERDFAHAARMREEIDTEETEQVLNLARAAKERSQSNVD